jgi:pyrroloquinoline quinone biosynthesis protein B
MLCCLMERSLTTTRCHLPLSGADGTLQTLARFAARRILTHINNTNPILVDGSRERHEVEAAGFEIAVDGMEIVI